MHVDPRQEAEIRAELENGYGLSYSECTRILNAASDAVKAIGGNDSDLQEMANTLVKVFLENGREL